MGFLSLVVPKRLEAGRDDDFPVELLLQL